MSSNKSSTRRSLLASFLCTPIAAQVAFAKTEKISAEQRDKLIGVGKTKNAIRYRSVSVDGVKIFYREAGPIQAPVLLCLHGYPSSSRMFESLFPLLCDKYRLIAPDYPGFGLSEAPAPAAYNYTFDHLAQTMQAFTEVLGLTRFSLYLQDYGGPIGFRLATMHPERIQALVIQNAVIHEEGLTDAWSVRRSYWKDRQGYEEKVRDAMYSVSAGIARHLGKRPDIEMYDPDLWMDEIAFLKRPGIEQIQLDLAFDYQSNVREYPHWQSYLREQKPKVLVVWGKHDPIFSVNGAQAIQRETRSGKVHVLDAGHFALDDSADEIAKDIREFLG